MNKLNQAGLDSEKLIMDWLAGLGHTVRASSEYENIFLDIDCFLDGIPCSIKTDLMAQKTGNIAFELMVKLKTGDWKKSWYSNSRAKVYLFRVGDAVYVASVLPERYLMRLVTLSHAQQTNQLASGHKHLSAQLGLISLDVLCSRGIFKEYGNVNRPEVTTTLFSHEAGQVLLPRAIPKPTLKTHRVD